jgi:hypothetical protein
MRIIMPITAVVRPDVTMVGRTVFQGGTMGKTGRKRRGRKKKAANHGKRPNA